MKCCINCFNDIEIKAIIEGINIKGNCDLCASEDVFVYDTSTNQNLTDLFDELLDIYDTADELPDKFPPSKLKELGEILKEQWDIFTISSDQILSLLKSICHGKFTEHPDLFASKVGILESIDEDYLNKNLVLKKYKWEDFVQEIKCKNRFHTNHINKDAFLLFFKYANSNFKAGQIFFRARISVNVGGYKITEMGAPPSRLASGGRANPEGISCLYLANTEETALYEVRAGIYDYVTIGEFELLEDIEVINLNQIDKISPFFAADINLTQHALNIESLRKMRNEIAKPLRRYDSSLDYLPTQYISDFIKSQGFKGIEYQSTMIQDGYNLAVFDENLFRCKSIKVYDVNSLKYSYTNI